VDALSSLMHTDNAYSIGKKNVWKVEGINSETAIWYSCSSGNRCKVISWNHQGLA
jgi:hypothetical protein